MGYVIDLAEVEKQIKVEKQLEGERVRIAELAEHAKRRHPLIEGALIEGAKAGEMAEIISDRDTIIALGETVEALAKLVCIMARRLRELSDGR